MTHSNEPRYYVAVIGAGPAGLFAARELAGRGFCTVLMNRDIKPGGLAEYGIYPTKIRMKEGLRSQFRQILAMDNLVYFGHVLFGQHADLALEDLRNMGFHAILVTVGAQSVKQIGIPGEDLLGVYHAKDIVYHYNVLPPYSATTYQIGKRVAVIGVGNVMMDITHWLVEEEHVESVVAVARRGPAEVKFDRKELESIIQYVDTASLDKELARVLPQMQAIGQEPGAFRAMIEHAVSKIPPDVPRTPRFHLRFLSSPAQILGEQGRVSGLVLEKNALVLGHDGDSRARGTETYETIDVDTVIFAIGDVVDASLGLPVQYGEYVKNPQPRFPVEGISYEAFDIRTNQVIADTFLAGWARRPSAGLVGVARKDATNAALAITQYLQTCSPTCAPVLARLEERLHEIGHPVVGKEDLARLEALEDEHAREENRPFYKFVTNEAMLEALGLQPPADH